MKPTSYNALGVRYAVWLHFRFTLSLRDVEDLLAERGSHIEVLDMLGRSPGRLVISMARTGVFNVPVS